MAISDFDKSLIKGKVTNSQTKESDFRSGLDLVIDQVDATEIELASYKPMIVGGTTPATEDTEIGDLWLDTATVPHGLNIYVKDASGVQNWEYIRTNVGIHKYSDDQLPFENKFYDTTNYTNLESGRAYYYITSGDIWITICTISVPAGFTLDGLYVNSNGGNAIKGIRFNGGSTQWSGNVIPSSTSGLGTFFNADLTQSELAGTETLDVQFLFSTGYEQGISAGYNKVTLKFIP